MDGDKPATPKVQTFKCLQCGSPISLRGLLQTTRVVCSRCGTVIDISDENMRIIGRFKERPTVKPAIPLGSRGAFPDGVFEAIGFMQRFITVEGVDYRWREYLLFNPFKGFRWLSEYNGHWSYIKTVMHQPRVLHIFGDGSITFKGSVFRHFQSANAKVEFVIGEFYWRVEAGQSCLVQDYVNPPQILSMERTSNEITWSLGEYVEPQEIATAFKLTTPLPARIGVGVNQPSPLVQQGESLKGLTALFLGIAISIQLISLAMSDNALVFQRNFLFNAAATEKSLVTDLFELSGRTSNVMVCTKADVNNNWLYVSMTLINDETGTAYDFGREIDYYFGSDSDGAWTEGSQTDEAILPAVPAGRYYLRIEPDGPASTRYLVSVYRDVPQWWPFLITTGLLLVLPLAVFWRRRSFEYQRWSESDHPMAKFGSGDDE